MSRQIAFCLDLRHVQISDSTAKPKLRFCGTHEGNEKQTEERLTRSSVSFYCKLLVDQLVRRVATPAEALWSSFSGWITTPSNGVAARKRPCTTLMWRNG